VSIQVSTQCRFRHQSQTPMDPCAGHRSARFYPVSRSPAHTSPIERRPNRLLEIDCRAPTGRAVVSLAHHEARPLEWCRRWRHVWRYVWRHTWERHSNGGLGLGLRARALHQRMRTLRTWPSPRARGSRQSTGILQRPVRLIPARPARGRPIRFLAKLGCARSESVRVVRWGDIWPASPALILLFADSGGRSLFAIDTPLLVAKLPRALGRVVAVRA
jgi:hypothetical protein